MQAHKNLYGALLRPDHLLSPYAMQIYHSALEVKLAQEVVLTEEQQQQYDTDIVAYLVGVRGESAEQVRNLLERSGLF